MPAGRPFSLTDEQVEQAVGFVSRGGSIRGAGDNIGVGRTSFKRWMARGREALDRDPSTWSEPDRKCASLALRIGQAVSEAELKHAQNLLNPGASGSSFFLARRGGDPWRELKNRREYVERQLKAEEKAAEGQDPNNPQDVAEALAELARSHPDMLRAALARAEGDTNAG